MEISFTNDELRQLKKTYCLCWHYLRQSFWYRKFCEIMHEAGIEANGKKGDLFDRTDTLFYSIYEKNKTKLKLSCPPNLWLLNSYWEFFGHVHLDRFGEWWEKNKNSLIKDFVIDLSDPKQTEFLFFFEAAVRWYRKVEGNNLPTPKEILELLTRDKEYVYVAIPLQELTIAEIGKQIADIRDKHRRNEQSIQIPRSKTFMLVGRKEIKYLARYLIYYKMENQYSLTKRQMIDKRQKDNNDKSDEEIKDEINSDISRAKKIIRNIEMGKFPGPYQPHNK